MHGSGIFDAGKIVQSRNYGHRRNYDNTPHRDAQVGPLGRGPLADTLHMHGPDHRLHGGYHGGPEHVPRSGSDASEAPLQRVLIHSDGGSGGTEITTNEQSATDPTLKDAFTSHTGPPHGRMTHFLSSRRQLSSDSLTRNRLVRSDTLKTSHRSQGSSDTLHGSYVGLPSLQLGNLR